jgi:hypothetical protein
MRSARGFDMPTASVGMAPMTEMAGNPPMTAGRMKKAGGFLGPRLNQHVTEPLGPEFITVYSFANLAF